MVSARRKIAVRRKTTRPRGLRGGAPESGEAVVVRMYNVGFGDAFVLTFPAPDRPRKVLIDCGAHVGGPPPVPLEKVVEAIIDDVTEDGEPRIDVVVCSHRHRDHVHGFGSEKWATVRVDEVWMPWTEHPTNRHARRIREAQARKARSLTAALAAHPGADTDERLKLARALAANALTNFEAMRTLHRGFKGRPARRFFPKERPGEVVETEALPGVRAHVLGPWRDDTIIKDMIPPPGKTFLRMANGDTAGGSPDGPFRPQWRLSPAGKAFGPWFRERSAAQEGDGDGPLGSAAPDEAAISAYLRSLEVDLRDLRAVDRAAEDDPLAIAVALDKAVNNTSLMLLFEVGSGFLLFPGDSQWGTWDRALHDEAQALRELLSRTTFYKVGHHGSHNSTPIEFVEEVMAPGFLAMVSTRAHTSAFDDIPRIPLLDALRLRPGLICRSDEEAVVAPFRRVSPLCVEARVPI